MAVELFVMAIVFGSGIVIAHAAGFRGWGIVPWGYALGTFAYIIVGVAQVVLGVTTSPVVTLLMLPILAGASLVASLLRGGIVRFPWALAGAGLIVGAVIAAIARVSHFTQWSYDSLRYLTVGELLYADVYTSTVSEVLLGKRLLAVGLLHSPASLDGGAVLTSVTPLLAASLFGLVVWFIQRGTMAILGTRPALY